jgi:hypothetical protein
MTDEQQCQTTTTAVHATLRSVCPHPEAIGKRWGDDISDERKKELLRLHDEQVRWLSETGPDRNLEQSPFALATSGLSVQGAGYRSLTGAEVYFLWQGSELEDLHLEGVNLLGAHLDGATFITKRLHLESANLWSAHLDGTHLDGTHLDGTHLEGANLLVAHLEGSYLSNAHLGALTSVAHSSAPRLTYLRQLYLTGSMAW